MSVPAAPPNPALLVSDTIAAAQFVGDAACISCHQEISAQHRASAHAHTLAYVRPTIQGGLFRLSTKFPDPGNGTTYQPTLDRGRCAIRSLSPVGTRLLPAEIAVGSGRHGHTYLGRDTSGPWLALRLSYYAGVKGWDFTPAQFPDPNHGGEFDGQTLDHGQMESCLSCHVTTLKMTEGSPEKAGTRFGIGCERCHGGGRAHVAAMRASLQGIKKGETKPGTDAGLEKLSLATAARTQEVCATCHSADANMQAGGATDPVSLSRFKSTAFALSKCYLKSSNFSCVTCHNPHTNASPNTASYEAVCQSCHRTATASAANNVLPPAPICKVNARDGCVRCHMPAQTPETFPHTVYHNHWIRVWPKPDPGVVPSALGANAVQRL